MKPFFSADKCKVEFDIRSPQSCISCGLYQDCTTPRMKPFGLFKKGVMFIGEVPGDIEDRIGKPWQGRTGRMLQSVLQDLGFHLFQDGISLNACNCKTADGDAPSSNQIYCCRPKIIKTIKKYKPKVIFLLGEAPLESLIGHRWKKKFGNMEKWRGFCIPDQDLKAWVCPIYHPSFISSYEQKRDLPNPTLVIWKRDIQNGLNHLDKPLPDYSNEEKNFEIIKTPKQLRQIIPKMIKSDLLSFDYETTSLKPHSNKTKLISVSASFNDKTYAWMHTHLMGKVWAKVLQSNVPKVAHNLQMEEEWSYWKLGTTVNNWKLCTMNGAHCIDNRRGINSLKFQTAINFGIFDYDSSVSSFLAPTDEEKKKYGGNAINRIYEYIKEFGYESLLKYNSYDSRWGLLLAKKQIQILFNE